jgi:hypothetical protein
MDHTAITKPVFPGPRASPYTITYALIAINVPVFVAMVASGISFTQPTPLDVVNWGGDFGPLTLAHINGGVCSPPALFISASSISALIFECFSRSGRLSK